MIKHSQIQTIVALRFQFWGRHNGISIANEFFARRDAHLRTYCCFEEPLLNRSIGNSKIRTPLHTVYINGFQLIEKIVLEMLSSRIDVEVFERQSSLPTTIQEKSVVGKTSSDAIEARVIAHPVS